MGIFDFEKQIFKWEILIWKIQLGYFEADCRPGKLSVTLWGLIFFSLNLLFLIVIVRGTGNLVHRCLKHLSSYLCFGKVQKI